MDKRCKFCDKGDKLVLTKKDEYCCRAEGITKVFDGEHKCHHPNEFYPRVTVKAGE